jgi:hypothetical protein
MSSVSPLSPVRILVEVTSRLWEQKIAILKASMPALSGLVLVDYINLNINPDLTLVRLIFGAVQIVLMAILAINIHRIVLLGRASVPDFGIFTWANRETRFLGWWIVAYFYLSMMLMFSSTIGLAVVDPFEVEFSQISVSAIIALLMFFIAIVAAITLFARISLLLPSTALDKRENMGWAFDISRGSSFRLAFLVGLAPAMSFLTPYILYFGNITFTIIVMYLVDYLLVMLGIAILSVCYRSLLISPDEPKSSE